MYLLRNISSVTFATMHFENKRLWHGRTTTTKIEIHFIKYKKSIDAFLIRVTEKMIII
jgi:hypothetical protein